jgi:hypothetical protein
MYDNTAVDTSLQPILPPAPVNVNGGVEFAQNIFGGIFSVGTVEFLIILITVLIIGLLTLIIFLLVRMYEIRKENERKLKPVAVPISMPTSVPGALGAPAENLIWKGIRERLLGDNQSEWKLSIIEADIYLDRVLDDKGFHGDTTSDKLKQVTPDKLPSVQIAWEVHKVRNRIAHDGAAFVITMPEARRLLSFYEIVFTDLGVL